MPRLYTVTNVPKYVREMPKYAQIYLIMPEYELI